MHQIVHLHAAAPLKPDEGAACNGCGVCCTSEPCPVGVLVSGRRHGACDALVWRDDLGRYRCGLIEQPASHLPPAVRWAAPLMARAARRLVAAGVGCDCDLQVERPAPSVATVG